MTEMQATSILILTISFILTVLFERSIIPILRQNAKQPIYEGGPVWHLVKSGTPTMGGIVFLAVAVPLLSLASVYFFKASNNRSAISIILVMLFSVLNSAVGIIDDMTKLRRRENAGLSPKQKLVLQFLIATVFVFAHTRLVGANTVMEFSFFKINIGFFYYPIIIIMLVGIVNCANLTDGIDGLASSVACAAAIALLAITGFNIPEIYFASCSLIGIMLGFLIFNFYPAKIFMGDTGSLFIGALLASCSLSFKNPLLIILICGAYVIEGISVILQVFFYKLTHKRLFKMAPLHHHLEKSGLSERKICALGAAATLGLSLIAYLLY